MQIQTYEIEEINSSEAATLAADGEAVELMEKLGLTGQQSLLSNDGNQTRFPYPVMTKLEALVYSTCFPQKTKLQDFAVEIIPVRVLQVAAFCRDFSQTAYLEIWHPPISKVDPILVGRKSCYSGEQYILARWGSALLPFETLLEQAKEKYKKVATLKLMKLESDLRLKRENMTLEIETAFATGDEPSFAIYA